MNVLEETVLELIGESVESPDVFTDDAEGIAPIRDSINDAIAEIVMLTGGNRREYFLPLREDMGFYRLRPGRGDVGWITDVWSVTQQRRLEQSDLTRLSAYDPRWMKTTGTPEAYLPIGTDVIGFYPKPASDSDVIQISLVEIPAAYATDRDRIKLKETFQYAVVSYAVSEYWASRGDANEAQKHLALYLDALGLRQQYMPQTPSYSLRTQKDPSPQVTG